jgi:hypothetical protein
MARLAEVFDRQYINPPGDQTELRGEALEMRAQV